MILLTDMPITIKQYSIGELAQIYEVDYRTFKKWIKDINHKIGVRRGRFYSIEQVIIILSHVRLPGKAIEAMPGCTTVYMDTTRNTAVILPMNFQTAA